jgi:hypothetical protein
MKRIPYDQMMIGLDQLLLSNQITNHEQTILYAEAIDNYLASTGWSWDLIINYMIEENTYGKAKSISTRTSN